MRDHAHRGDGRGGVVLEVVALAEVGLGLLELVVDLILGFGFRSKVEGAGLRA